MRPVVATLLLIVACAPPQSTTSPSPTATGALPTATLGGLARGVSADVSAARRWHLVPDGLQQEPVTITAHFAVDPRPGEPRVRVAGRDAPMSVIAGGPRGFTATGLVPLEGLSPGEHRADVVTRIADGGEGIAGSTTFILSQPEYVVWTLDFEGDDASDANMANTAAVADALTVPMTVMWNPRVWTTTQVSAARAEAMLAWTRGRAAKGDEIALHLHMWTDYVRAAGVAPRTTPNWGGRSDGYDVPMTAFTEGETRTLVEYGLRLMAERGLPRPTSFRAGALFANAGTLRAIAALGFTADCSATPAGPFGSLQLPWTLPRDAQPYYPARDDANKPGDLPLLEAPTNAGNTFGHSAASIEGIVQADLRMLAPPGRAAAERRGLTVVSHPATIDGTERAAIETLFLAFEPLRYDRDAGPLRFVTLAQLAKAFAR
ncbi:MAG TPA: hypothetical protein VJP45_09585 [Candidatus Limnocylindria bacterium]|nr:hypothetical protein [Candidatus Limnocylindria bacterium]